MDGHASTNMAGIMSEHGDAYLQSRWIEENQGSFTSRVGSGAFGDVYRSTEENLVVKVLKRGSIEDIAMEITILSLLHKRRVTGVPHMHGWTDSWGEERNQLAIIFEDAGSLDLHNLMSRNGAITERQLDDISGQLVFTVLTMHLLAGVTHGDIAPSNIVVDVDDTTGKTTATLVDFGGSIMGKVGQRVDWQHAFRMEYLCPFVVYSAMEKFLGVRKAQRVFDGLHNGLWTDLFALGRTIAKCAKWKVHPHRGGLMGSLPNRNRELFKFLRKVVSSRIEDRLDARGVFEDEFFQRWMRANPSATLDLLQRMVNHTPAGSASPCQPLDVCAIKSASTGFTPRAVRVCPPAGTDRVRRPLEGWDINTSARPTTPPVDNAGWQQGFGGVPRLTVGDRVVSVPVTRRNPPAARRVFRLPYSHRTGHDGPMLCPPNLLLDSSVGEKSLMQIHGAAAHPCGGGDKHRAQSYEDVRAAGAESARREGAVGTAGRCAKVQIHGAVAHPCGGGDQHPAQSYEDVYAAGAKSPRREGAVGTAGRCAKRTRVVASRMAQGQGPHTPRQDIENYDGYPWHPSRQQRDAGFGFDDRIVRWSGNSPSNDQRGSEKLPSLFR